MASAARTMRRAATSPRVFSPHRASRSSIGQVRVVDAVVGRDAGGACGHAGPAEGQYGLASSCSGALRCGSTKLPALEESSRGRPRSQPAGSPACSGRRSSASSQVVAQAAEADDAHQEAMPGELLVQALQPFLEDGALRAARRGSPAPAQMLPMSPTWL